MWEIELIQKNNASWSWSVNAITVDERGQIYGTFYGQNSITKIIPSADEPCPTFFDALRDAMEVTKDRPFKLTVQTNKMERKTYE